MGKPLEKILGVRLTEFGVTSGTITNNHFAYFTGKGTADAAIYTVTTIEEWEIEGKATNSVAIDYTAAFDTVKHKRIKKVFKEKYGIDGKFLKILGSFLSERKNRTVIDGITSEWREQINGTPQGSPLSQVIFVFMVNVVVDKAEKIYNVILVIYADDIIVLEKHEIKGSTENMNRCLRYISTRSRREGLKLNMGKCEFMVFDINERLTNKEKDEMIININGERIIRKTKIKYLGIIIDEKLTFTEHIENRISKTYWIMDVINKQIGRIGRVKMNIKVNLIQALVLPILMYGCEFSRMSTKESKQKMKTLYGKFIKKTGNTHNNMAGYRSLKILLNLHDLDIIWDGEIAQLFTKMIRIPKSNRLYNTVKNRWWKWKKWEDETDDTKETGTYANKRDIGNRRNFIDSLYIISRRWETWDYRLLSNKWIKLENIQKYTDHKIILEKIRNTKFNTKPWKRHNTEKIEKWLREGYEVMIIFTDGSVKPYKKDYKGIGAGGLGCYVLNINDRKKIKLIKGTSTRTTIDMCEMGAIVEALQYVNKEKKGRKVKIQIISDSETCLKLLNNQYGTNSNIIEKKIKKIAKIMEENKEWDLELRHVKAHVNYKPNEVVDRLAKIGMIKMLDKVRKGENIHEWDEISYKTVKKGCRRLRNKRMQDRTKNYHKNGAKISKMMLEKYRITWEDQYKKEMKILTVKEHSWLTQVRTEAINMGIYKIRMGWMRDIGNVCDICGEDNDTVEHYIMKCEMYEGEREEMMEEVKEIMRENGIKINKGKNITIRDILWPRKYHKTRNRKNNNRITESWETILQNKNANSIGINDKSDRNKSDDNDEEEMEEKIEKWKRTTYQKIETKQKTKRARWKVKEIGKIDKINEEESEEYNKEEDLKEFLKEKQETITRLEKILNNNKKWLPCEERHDKKYIKSIKSKDRLRITESLIRYIRKTGRMTSNKKWDFWNKIQDGMMKYEDDDLLITTDEEISAGAGEEEETKRTNVNMKTKTNNVNNVDIERKMECKNKNYNQFKKTVMKNKNRSNIRKESNIFTQKKKERKQNYDIFNIKQHKKKKKE